MKELDELCIIMNPPYDKNLHLDILDKVIEEFPENEIVNLSPVRWLQDPLAEYKKNSDWNKFKNIREKIEDLEIIKSVDAEKYFNIGLPFNLGIYKINNNGKFVENKNVIFNKIIKKVTSGIVLKDKIVIDDLDGISCLISLFTGGRNGGLEKETPFMMPRKKCFFSNKKNEFTGETYLEQREKTAWGNVKAKSENTNIKFNTKEERENFYNSWNKNVLRWLFNKEKVDVNVHPQFLPFMPTYEHEWTDEMLYEYFDLTEDEIKIIEEEIDSLV